MKLQFCLIYLKLKLIKKFSQFQTTETTTVTYKNYIINSLF